MAHCCQASRLRRNQGCCALIIIIIIIIIIISSFLNLTSTFNKVFRLRVFENRILRGIFGNKRDKNGEWRRFHNEELNSLYHSPNKIRVIKSRRLRWASHVARMEEVRCVFKILSGKFTGKRPLRRPRHRWKDNITMDLKEIGVNTRNSIDFIIRYLKPYYRSS